MARRGSYKTKRWKHLPKIVFDPAILGDVFERERCSDQGFESGTIVGMQLAIDQFDALQMQDYWSSLRSRGVINRYDVESTSSEGGDEDTLRIATWLTGYSRLGDNPQGRTTGIAIDTGDNAVSMPESIPSIFSYSCYYIGTIQKEMQVKAKQL